MTFDPIALIERAYRPYSSVEAWTKAMALPITENLDPDRLGCVNYVMHQSGPLKPLWFARDNEVSADGAASSPWSAAVPSDCPVERKRVANLIRTPGLYRLSDALSRSGAQEDSHQREVPAVVVHDSQGLPVVFATSTSAQFPIDQATRNIWRRLALHLGAGYRLVGRQLGPAASDVESVLSPDGATLHATGRGQSQSVRDELREAVKHLDRLRTRRGRADPEAALEMWLGLLVGRWSLVDHFDSDGRRFLLAVRSDVPLPDRPIASALPLRQRQILYYASAGWSNKEVGYALGLATPTVATHLRRALARLRITSRSELVRIATSVCA